MNKLIIVIGFALTLNLLHGQTKNFIDQPFLETLAKVDTLVIPDRIYLSILIAESDTKGKQTIEDLEFKMAEKLKAIGIDLDKQLSLIDLSSNFKKYFIRKQDILKLKSFELLVYDAKTAGLVIYELERIGISNVDLDYTTYSKIEDLKIKLKSMAIKKAKQQAEAMVKPLNQSIGKAIFISDTNTNIVNGLSARVVGITIRGTSSKSFDKEQYMPIPIEFEKIKVESSVNVHFIIK